MFVYFFIYGPLVLSCKSYLGYMGYDEQIVSITHKIAMLRYPALFLELLSELIITYCYSLGFESEAFFIGVVSFFGSGITIIMLCFYWNYGLYGWICSTYMFTAINLTGSLIIYFSKLDRRAIGLPRASYMFTGFGSYVWDCLKYITGVYLEWSGTEILHLLVAITTVSAQIAGDAAIGNIVYIVFNIGLGFSTVGRTRVNLMLSKKRPRAAKNIFVLFLLGNLIVGVAIGGLIYCGRSYLLKLYAGAEVEISYFLNRQLIGYCFCVVSDLLLPFMFSTTRTVGILATSIGLAAAFLILGQVAVGIFILKHRPDSLLLLVNTYATYYVLYCILLVIMFTKDWSKVVVTAVENSHIEMAVLAYKEEKDQRLTQKLIFE